MPNSDPSLKENPQTGYSTAAADTAAESSLPDGVVDVQQSEQLRKIPLSWWHRLRFYLTLFSGVVAVGAVMIFIFLVPFIIEPSLSTIQMDFHPTPATCCVTSFSTASGASSCKGVSSCREGCTHDVYECFQIRVAYTDAANFSCQSPPPDHQWIFNNATLFPNIKGCGYPPSVNCSLFRSRFGRVNVMFPCHYSSKDPTLVITSLDPAGLKRHLALSVFLPLFSFIAAFVFLMYQLYTQKPVVKVVAPVEEHKKITSMPSLAKKIGLPSIVKLLHQKSLSEPLMFETSTLKEMKSRSVSSHAVDHLIYSTMKTGRTTLFVDEKGSANHRRPLQRSRPLLTNDQTYSWTVEAAVPPSCSEPSDRTES